MCKVDAEEQAMLQQALAMSQEGAGGGFAADAGFDMMVCGKRSATLRQRSHSVCVFFCLRTFMENGIPPLRIWPI
jgi:hypothetical protein